ncbi:tRNA pseudouridine(38-40) synthase TruA [Hazenella sp. IB182357]|uniref:tRNA pseudouridine synthase A n=1 Tax=Polycladospora coralii TaxID=2771432 RepID=A0A926NFA3_9BACL|nr:tRNA pseudouridine(38-40) synthase TruA [Polycladospora coralii]MBD1372333.1 tRNA pseudouridine(38-40) synthase TruA [Polycladospora coralii]MBS7531477.1 tRNA pseudouridine(38-40) synthase TruA [Polycladospora coralii]
MTKIKLDIQYDGTEFAGFQRQPGQRTVQGALEKALSKITHESITVFASGRTDAGVHALGQVCHFETDAPIPAEKYTYVLRRFLPIDIVVTKGSIAEPSFHAQFSARWKRYCYQIDLARIPNLLERRFRAHVPQKLNVDNMMEATKYFEGTHDFTSFCSVKTVVENRVRTIYRCRVIPTELGLTIEVVGNGFLYNMVRIMTGTLVGVGRGRFQPQEIQRMIAARDRQAAGPTFSPHGLFLMDVGYKPWSDMQIADFGSE